MDHELVDDILSSFRPVLKVDFEKYRNHCHRLVSLMQYLDPALFGQHAEEYLVAVAFHDLGIWTHKTMDYLGPSKALATEYTGPESEFISRAIDFHHSPFTVETAPDLLRRADWIDVTASLFTPWHMDAYRSVVREFPLKGFHQMIGKEVLMRAIRYPLKPFPMIRF